jgi:predicted phosphoadenosine phosphosulfate sulfurtransferase
LVEEYFTKEREWVSEYDIYPLHDYYVSGAWTYDATYDNLVPSTYYHLFKK